MLLMAAELAAVAVNVVIVKCNNTDTERAREERHRAHY